MTDEPPDHDDDAALAQRLPEAFARRGELLPTTEAEVLALEAELAEAERAGESAPLPPGLAKYAPPSGTEPVIRESAPKRGSTRAGSPEGSDGASRDGRPLALVPGSDRAPPRPVPLLRHLPAFVVGAAAAAAVFAVIGPGIERGAPGRDPSAAGASSNTPEPVASAPAVVIPAIGVCPKDCCAGASCAAATGELRACASGRTCLGCGEVDRQSAYRVRLGAFTATDRLAPKQLATLDLCARIGVTEPACAPLILDAERRVAGRTLPAVASVAELAAGLELSLRVRGTTQVVATRRESVRIGKVSLCHGIGLLLADAKGDIGSVSVFLDDAHHVELGRAAGVGDLETMRAGLSFGDLTPRIHETSARAGARFVLSLGPLDHASAERARWALIERGVRAEQSFGEDYLPGPRPEP